MYKGGMLYWTQDRLDRAEQLVWEGARKSDLCRKMGVSWDAIRRAFSRHGRELPPFLRISPSRIPAVLRRKVSRRARRHFEGNTPTHRVGQTGPDFIEFRFNRYTRKYKVPAGTTITVSL